MFSIVVPVTDAQLDPEYRHVHHSVVLCLLEKARVAFIESAGLPQAKLFAQDLWAVISEIHIEYLREVKEGEYLATCDSIKAERRRMTFDQRLLDSEGREAVQAKIKIFWFSKKAGKAVMPPEDVMKAITQRISEI